MSKSTTLSNLVSDGGPWSVLSQKNNLGNLCFGY